MHGACPPQQYSVDMTLSPVGQRAAAAPAAGYASAAAPAAPAAAPLPPQAPGPPALAQQPAAAAAAAPAPADAVKKAGDEGGKEKKKGGKKGKEKEKGSKGKGGKDKKQQSKKKSKSKGSSSDSSSSDSSSSSSSSDSDGGGALGRALQPWRYPLYSPSASYRQLDVIAGSHQYTMSGFSLARSMGCGTRLCSDFFEVAGQMFRLEVYPAGFTADTRRHVSAFLTTPGCINPNHVLYEVAVLDQSGRDRHIAASRGARADQRGPLLTYCQGIVAAVPRLAAAKDLERHARRYLPGDALVIRATVQVLRGWSSAPMVHQHSSAVAAAAAGPPYGMQYGMYGGGMGGMGVGGMQRPHMGGLLGSPTHHQLYAHAAASYQPYGSASPYSSPVAACGPYGGVASPTRLAAAAAYPCY